MDPGKQLQKRILAPLSGWVSEEQSHDCSFRSLCCCVNISQWPASCAPDVSEIFFGFFGRKTQLHLEFSLSYFVFSSSSPTPILFGKFLFLYFCHWLARYNSSGNFPWNLWQHLMYGGFWYVIQLGTHIQSFVHRIFKVSWLRGIKTEIFCVWLHGTEHSICTCTELVAAGLLSLSLSCARALDCLNLALHFWSYSSLFWYYWT
jgi:hypothetical protein